ncbi:MAG TPA: ATP synthase F0 subunit C [Verrucomicrobiae bacterium]|nr:ATP synthase F0 subunit C [Verrucomicrobiae bacterium]
MSKRTMTLLASFLIASPTMFAQASGGQPEKSYWIPVAAVFAMAIASGLAALAQGKAVVGAAEGMARNPGATTAIRFALLLGLVLIESLALYTLVVSFTVIFQK